MSIRKYLVTGLFLGLLVKPLISPARPAQNHATHALGALRVQVLSVDPLSGHILSSGFWLSKEGLVATCWRNISSNPDVVSVKLPGTGETLQAKLVAKDIEEDLALLQVSLNASQVSNSAAEMQLDDASGQPSPGSAKSLLNVGENVFAQGSGSDQPSDRIQKLAVEAVGPIAALAGRRKILLTGQERYGLPGEPVVNSAGRVVGMLEGPYTSSVKHLDNAEVAIPIETILDVAKKRKSPDHAVNK
jgi:S1-C subfamily serine protease